MKISDKKSRNKNFEIREQKLQKSVNKNYKNLETKKRGSEGTTESVGTKIIMFETKLCDSRNNENYTWER
jgi:hypothetical protein